MKPGIHRKSRSHSQIILLLEAAVPKIWARVCFATQVYRAGWGTIRRSMEFPYCQAFGATVVWENEKDKRLILSVPFGCAYRLSLLRRSAQGQR
jgi:hypothetical protein